jgi:hypothetical protein
VVRRRSAGRGPDGVEDLARDVAVGTTARTSSLLPQWAQAFTWTSKVRASNVAHGTFEVAA